MMIHQIYSSLRDCFLSSTQEEQYQALRRLYSKKIVDNLAGGAIILVSPETLH